MLDDIGTVNENKRLSVQPSDTVIFSIVICSYRRYEYLSQLTDHLLQLYGKRSDTEIIIIDNTEDCAAKNQFYSAVTFSENVRVLHSYPPGLSRARNVGMNEAQGKFLAYIDDDARPSAEWLDSIGETFEKFPDAGVIAGPILPIWPESGRPSWIPKKYEGCLTILDLGDTPRRLNDHEYAYGANMSFRTDCLKAVGGFPEQLGRTGSIGLLSNEELHAQQCARNQNWSIYYSPGAMVFHHVHPDRLNQSWFRRRMAWQVVSESLQHQRLEDPHGKISSLSESAAKLDISTNILNAFRDSHDPNVLEAQVKFIMDLTSLALSTSGAITLEESNAVQKREFTGSYSEKMPDLRREGPADAYRPRAALNVTAGGTIFLEAIPQHEYLYDCYSHLGNTALLKEEFDPWADSAALINFIRFGLTAAQDYRSALFLLTLDHLLQGKVTDQFEKLVSLSRVPVYGILHRVPTEPELIKRLIQLSAVARKVIVLSGDIKSDIDSKFGLTNVEVLPHHATISGIPSLSKAKIRYKLGIPSNRCVISVLGEAREGKGLELIMEALKLLGRFEASRVCFLFGGKAPPYLIEQITNLCRENDLLACIKLQHVPEQRQYAALSDLEYADYVRASDIGLLLYQGPQRLGASGVLPNYIHSGASVIATANSYTGRVVSANSLGQCIVEETPQELADAIRKSVEAYFGEQELQKPESYLADIAESNVIQRLNGILAR